MKFINALIYTLILCLSTLHLYAQSPVNDDCVGLIDLGVAPNCNTAFFSNLNATASDIGAENIPTCFNGGTVQRDVWFAFTASDTITDYTITVTGITDGAGSTPMLMPQLALYRGDCQVDGLAELLCASAPLNEGVVTLDVFGLTPGVVYFLRINDYSASASPNSGSFQLCVDEYVPAINIGTIPSTGSCFGTLYDSGGPDGNYAANENFTFTICPQQAHACINMSMLSFDTENGFDEITFFSGTTINDPVLAVVSGAGVANFDIQAASNCVTIQFTSDGSVNNAGFEMTWECSTIPCTGTSPQNPTVINTVPFSQTGLTTCTDASNFAANPCNAAFLEGPEYVYSYTSPGDICVQINVTGADAGTGIAVFFGDPTDPNSTCIRSIPGTFVNSVNMEQAGTYYIVIGNAEGCTDFNIEITPTDCQLQPSLANALCNPLNGCASYDANGNAIPTTFFFEQGFEDIPIITGTNGGCWLGAGFEPDYYWFSIEAQADGPFGFIMSSGGDNTDIDINVWGPFTRQQVCDSQNVVINFITNNQPIRSSWSAGQIHTGLVDVHPDTGIPVTDVYDCDGNPGAGGDDFVSTIQAQLGDVYIVLANDFGEGIQENGMVIDWSPSLPAVIENPPVEVTNADTVICEGQSVQLIINAAIDDITWLNPIGLSCDDCPNPIATPEVTTIYQVAVEGVCLHDTIDVKVYVYNLYPMDDAIVCAGEEFQYVAIPQELPGATITWQDPGGLLSCTDCPNPIVLATTPGNYTLTVRLDAPLCTHYDTINVQVLQTPAPTYNIADNMQICQGDSVHLGGAHILGMNYEWSSVPAGFSSALADPVVAPDSTTQYYLQVTNGICPLPSIDSVLVTVNSLPLLAVVNDTLVCQGQSVVLGTTTTQNNVTYNWTPNIGLSNDTIPNPVSSPTATQTYTLSATIGACTTTEQVTINVTPIAIDIALDDSLRICKGTPVNIIANETPSGTLVSWLPNDGSLSSNTGDNVTANPTNTTLYVATVQVAGCTRKDSLFIQVDSLPNYALAISPQDTTVCQGALVILRSNPYDPAHFPFVDIEWIPSTGFVSPDSLYNIVLNATQTTTYNRIVTSGACKDTTSATVNVIETSSISVIPADTTVCFGQVVNFVASNPDTDEFMWQPPTGLSCTDCPNPSTTVYGSQTYIVSANVQGCPVSSSVTISIPPPPIFQLPENPVICLGQSLILNAQMDNETTYSWTSTDPSFVPTNAPSPTVSPSETQTYTLTATKGGCSINAQVTVTVAVATLTVDDEVTLCLGENATLNATGTLPGSLVWSNGENANSITVAPTESAYYSVVYTFGNGCTLTDSVYVNVVDNFILALDADPSVPEIHEGSNVQLTANTNPDLTNPSYVWTGNGAAIGGNNATVTVQPIINPSSYSVTVTSQNGCSHEATITFVVIPASYDIPNAFSPDGDNVNDLFRPIINGNINIEQFQIFDRWGQRVFESKTTDGWNGTFKDKPLPSDVYAYMLILNLPKGERKILKGDVTLLR